MQKASDGVSEIIECVDPNKFIFGVHFHPELIKTEVFNYFIDRVKIVNKENVKCY